MTTYSQLKADIANYTARNDLTSPIVAAIRIAEAEIFRVVRILEQETDATLTFNSGNSFADDLPTGYLGFKSLYVAGSSNPRVSYVPPQTFHVLDNLPDDAFAEFSRSDYLYTIESNKVKIDVPSGATSEVTFNVVYHKRQTALSDSNTTNDILTDHYDLYLMGGLKEVWDYVDEQEMVDKYSRRFDKIVAQIMDHEADRRRPAGPLIRRAPLGRVV